MKFRKAVTTYEEVEVEGPLYFCQHLDNSTFYGRVEEGQCLSVHEQDYERCYEIKMEIEPAVSFSCYLKPEYACTKKEFDEVLVRAQEWVASLALM